MSVQRAIGKHHTRLAEITECRRRHVLLQKTPTVSADSGTDQPAFAHAGERR